MLEIKKVKTVDDAIEKFHTDNEIRYILSAVNGDGEVIAQYKSSISADDVAGYAGLLDDRIFDLAIESANDVTDMSGATEQEFGR